VLHTSELEQKSLSFKPLLSLTTHVENQISAQWHFCGGGRAGPFYFIPSAVGRRPDARPVFTRPAEPSGGPPHAWATFVHEVEASRLAITGVLSIRPAYDRELVVRGFDAL
jgi:hypothetical protein